MRHSLFALVLAAALASQLAPAQASPGGDRLKQMLTKQIAVTLRQQPQVATFLGDYEHDADLSTPGRAGLIAAQRSLDKFEHALNGVDMKGATLGERNDLRLLRALIVGQRRQLAEARAGKDAGGPPLEIVGVIFTMIMHKDEQDRNVWWNHAISRIEKAPAWLAAERTLITHPGRLQAEVASKQLANAPGLFTGLLAGMASTDLSGPRKARFDKASGALVASLTEWKSWLDANARNWPLNYAMGRPAYEKMLKDELLLPYDANGIAAIGQNVLAGASAQESAVLADAKAKGIDLKDAKRAATVGGGTTPTTKDEQFAFFQGALDTLNTFVRDKHIVTIPDYMGTMRIVETPPFLQPILPGPSMDAPPLLSRHKDGVYFVPPPDPQMTQRAAAGAIFEDFDRDRVLMTSGHEGIPGHFLQLSIAKHNPNPIRRFSFDSVFAEGWAFYEERLLEQQGLYGTAGLDGRYAVAQFERLRGARAVVDAKLATGEWPFDQALSWFKENAGVDDATALGEVSRHALNPGQAFDYAVGRAQIDELLAKYRARKGSAFDLQAFHDDLLSHGTIPLSVVAAEMLAK
ncbi:MAG: DUF885 domain-containing protein [Candidatus Eremiobacteraeota bacterium]|nr:DUF885 domain-containing protein [Candidatus Eremiobacteraeota bacterium]MBC5827142.1 DUF885 domain-containing protein [Candidatus Eremiobacteraeota bacterium]